MVSVPEASGISNLLSGTRPILHVINNTLTSLQHLSDGRRYVKMPKYPYMCSLNKFIPPNFDNGILPFEVQFKIE